MKQKMSDNVRLEYNLLATGGVNSVLSANRATVCCTASELGIWKLVGNVFDYSVFNRG